MITITIELNKKEDNKIQLLERLQTGTGEWQKWESEVHYDQHCFKSFELNEDYKIRGMDLILATTPDDVTEIWLGYWNDGVV